jgi:hypothetical protein
MPGFNKVRPGKPVTPEQLSEIQKPEPPVDVRDILQWNQPSLLSSTDSTISKKNKQVNKAISGLQADNIRVLMQLNYLNEHQVALIIGCSVSKLRSDRHLSKGLPYTKNGRSVRYSRVDIEEYMKQRKIDPNLL